MPSSFGWLDNDDEQRRRMLEVVDLFKEQNTVDDLGIGSIRDTLSALLFPGTSTLHTRLRYVLFIPWLMQRAAGKHTAQEMVAEFRVLEYQLIESLLRGGESQGVQGSSARGRLQRLPSSAYWSALTTWGLVDASLSTQAYFRRQIAYRGLVARTSAADDGEARELLPGRGIDDHLPPAPGSFLTSASFSLTPSEEAFLSDRITATTPGSLLAWLVANPPSGSADARFGSAVAFAWDIENLADAPGDLVRMVDHARRFSEVMHGATIAYNLALARKSGSDDRAAIYEGAMVAWQGAGDAAEVARTWNDSDFWRLLETKNTRIGPTTRGFVNNWIALARAGDGLWNSPEAERLVAHRERQIKGARARLANQAALDRWSGSSGMGRLDFRWPVARQHLADLYAARGES